MGIAISDDHLELSNVAEAFLANTGALAEARSLLDAPEETLPAAWKEMADLGWLGLHLPEAHGGSGFGLAELVLVVEAMGAVVAPGPFLPTVWASAVIAACGTDAQQAELLPGLADGSVRAAVGLDDRTNLVLGAGLADLFLLPAGDDLVVATRDDVTVTMPTNTDTTRRVGSVTLNGAAAPDRVLTGARATAVVLGRVLAAAEATGGAQACVTMASEYAKVREQFGRVIAMFQAVKHQAADMLVATQLATAATWDAARTEPGTAEFELAAAIAAVAGAPRVRDVRGEEHPAARRHRLHVGARRARVPQARAQRSPRSSVPRARSTATSHGSPAPASRARTRSSCRPRPRRTAPRCAPSSTSTAPSPKPSSSVSSSTPATRSRHWPAPWGRAAGAVEQLVIEEELRAAGVRPPQYGIGGWIIQTLTQYADPDQLERWIRPSLEYQHTWCQLFSEPGAGSDAAGVRTKATKVDGGWKVTGQKVWTTGAAQCDRGLATVRTDPDKPKHDGITVLVIDLHAPGVDIRPLREATGHALFNEVFFDDVFVSDEDVVGPVNGGWKVARSTLGNERVSIGGGGGGIGDPMFDLLDLADRYADDDASGARADRAPAVGARQHAPAQPAHRRARRRRG